MQVRLGRPSTSALHEPHLAGLAVPADGEVGRLVTLDPVEGIEDDHPLLDGDVELVEATFLAGAAAEDPQVCIRHRCLRRQWSLLPSRPRSSSVIAGSGLVETAIVPSDDRATTLLR